MSKTAETVQPLEVEFADLPAVPTPKSEPGAAKTTTYVVLRELKPGSWAIEHHVPAANAEAAIRLACKADDNPAGTYVAVPARSWKPIVVKTEVQTLLKLEDAAG